MEKKHAILSPSSADRWLVCTGSVLSAHIKTPSSTEAEEGTLAHALAEKIYNLKKSGKPVQEEIDKISDVEMQLAVNDYINFLASLGGEFTTECTISLEQVTGEENAVCTIDAIHCDKINKIVNIVDFKYGVGSYIKADCNQLMLYVCAVFTKFKTLQDYEFRTYIFQPRLENVSSYVLRKDEILNKLAIFRASAARCLDVLFDREKPSFVPGVSSCRYCPKKGACSAQIRAVEEFLTRSSYDCTPAEISSLYGQIKAVKDACKSVSDRAFDLAQKNLLPGYKLGKGRSLPRRWVDDNAAATLAAFYGITNAIEKTEKIISPTQLEKLYKTGEINNDQWNEFQKLIEKPEGNDTLVQDDIKRG
jgi:hypothetical protein